MDFEQSSEREGKIIYRGKEITEFPSTGFPYKGAVSIFEEVKRKKNIAESKGKKFQLDDFTVYDLATESGGYERRADSYYDRDLEKRIADLDKARAIASFIYKDALSERYKERGKYNFHRLNLLLTYSLSAYAVEQLNYAWARQIIEGEIKEIKEQKSKESSFDDINYDELISDLEQRLQHVDIRQRNFGGDIECIAPMNTLHSRSLYQLLKDYNEKGEYKESAKIQEEIESIEKKLEKTLYPVVIAIGKEFLLRHVSKDAKFQIKERFLRIKDPKEVILIHQRESGKLGIKTHGREAHSRLLGILHSDKIVFEFGRFFRVDFSCV